MESSSKGTQFARLRVLSVIDSLGPGGAERSLLEMIPGLRSHGIDVDIAILKLAEPNIHDAAAAVGIEPILVGGPGRVSSVRSLRRQIKNGDYSLVHTNLYEADIAGRVAALASGVPVLTSLVNERYSPERLNDPNVRSTRLRAARVVDRFTARRLTDHFHAISHAVEASAMSALGISPERITVIPRGRDPIRLGRRDDERRRLARHELGIDPEAPVLLSVGRLEYQKGQRYAIQAMPEIVRSFPDAILLIAGREGWEAEALRSLTQELGLGSSVVFLGHREDVPELLTASDVFVFPSRYEGLGGAVLEAMALEVPVVASALPAVLEVLDGTGLTFPPSDVPVLIRAVLEVLNEPGTARNRTRAARARFEDRFSLDRVVEATNDLYRRVAAGRS